MINKIFLRTHYLWRMKLRMETGNIKIRLTPAEIETFNTDKFLQEKLSLTENNYFSYAISINDTSGSCLVIFEQNALNIHVPGKKVEKWLNSKQIGIKETIVTEEGNEIVLTLEEDLPPRKHKQRN